MGDALGRLADDFEDHIAAHGKTGEREARRGGCKDTRCHAGNGVIQRHIGNDRGDLVAEPGDDGMPEIGIATQSGDQNDGLEHEGLLKSWEAEVTERKKGGKAPAGFHRFGPAFSASCFDMDRRCVLSYIRRHLDQQPLVGRRGFVATAL
jgi:hypothetical protein